ncbi:MAG: type II toxin-antitoxin system PemK/MazF family toxin [Desulfobacterales bacterium]|nr:type II toxin-antitoxin system PemK/MazF family toxin [Desulfobacterales bacterium]
MITEGQIVLFRFPQTDQQTGKFRPALIIRKLPMYYNDWLVCMISSHVEKEILEFDEIITKNDPDFMGSGLKVPSLIRIGKLAVVSEHIFIGKIGQVDNLRLSRVKRKLSQWILAS